MHQSERKIIYYDFKSHDAHFYYILSILLNDRTPAGEAAHIAQHTLHRTEFQQKEMEENIKFIEQITHITTW